MMSRREDDDWKRYLDAYYTEKTPSIWHTERDLIIFGILGMVFATGAVLSFFYMCYCLLTGIPIG